MMQAVSAPGQQAARPRRQHPRAESGLLALLRHLGLGQSSSCRTSVRGLLRQLLEQLADRDDREAQSGEAVFARVHQDRRRCHRAATPVSDAAYRVRCRDRFRAAGGESSTVAAVPRAAR